MKKETFFAFIAFICYVPVLAFTKPVTKPANQPDSLIIACIDDINKDSIISYVQALQNFQTRFMIAPNRRQIAEWIRTKFENLGISNIRIDSALCTTEIDIDIFNLHFDTLTWQYNVVASVEGTENPDEYLILGAHYDDIVATIDGEPLLFAPGADDNASGVAALFETARILLSHNYTPKNSIELIAFAAEELLYYGQAGSEMYVLNAIETGKNIRLMINNDMIANTQTEDWKIFVSNYQGCEWLTQLTKETAENFTSIQPVLRASEPIADGDCFYFYENGFPCVYLMEKDMNPYYHTINDISANCNFDYCSEAIGISIGVLLTADDLLLGSNEFTAENSIRFYPNPTDGHLVLSIGDILLDKNPVVRICSQSGQLLAKKIITNPITIINELQDKPNGIYLLTIQTEGFAKTLKVSVCK